DDGNSPLAMRSVQSAKSCRPLSGPIRPSVSAMFAIAWPACVRTVQASVEVLNSPSLDESVRTPCEPSAWQDWQEVLIVSIQYACVFITSGMPLPFGPVPGKSLTGGIFSIAYQYMPG